MTTLTTESWRAETAAVVRPRPNLNLSIARVRLLGWSASICVALFMHWTGRYGMTVDGMSYLDIADGYLHHFSWSAVNGYWSPVYSWALALGLGILKPAASWEFAAVQVVNFAILLGTLCAFDFFWFAQWRQVREESESSELSSVTWPAWAWAALGYSLFIWMIANGTVVSEVTPDLLLAGVLFAAMGLMVRIRSGQGRTGTIFCLGLALGAGYLTKGVMLPLAIIFFGVAFFALVGKNKGRILVGLAAFMLVAGPYIAAISHVKGHLTFGDSGKINYAWGLNRTAPFFNWQGEDPAGGTPQHPTRKIFQTPAVYEFATPVAGTYPPHYDPSYWNAGLSAHFNLRDQLRAVVTGSYVAYETVLLPHSGLIAIALLLLVGAGRWSEATTRFFRYWHLWIPAVAALGMYALVTVEARYVAGFVIVLWAAILSAIRLPDSLLSDRLCKAAALIAVAMLLGAASEKLALRMYEWKQRSTNSWWMVADDLHHLGLDAGDKVATLGSGYNAYWAPLARLKIVAEIQSNDATSFWASSEHTKSEIFAACERAGAKAMVTREVPSAGPGSSWVKLGGTGYYAHVLEPTGTRNLN